MNTDYSGTPLDITTEEGRKNQAELDDLATQLRLGKGEKVRTAAGWITYAQAFGMRTEDARELAIILAIPGATLKEDS